MKKFWSKSHLDSKGFCACLPGNWHFPRFFCCLNEFHGDYDIGGKCIAFTCAL